MLKRSALAAFAAACVLVAGHTPRVAGQATAHLTASDRLSRVYDDILSARFDEARTALARSCPPAPGPACQALGAAARWWEIQQDPSSRRLDAAIQRESEQAIAAARTWTEREPQRAEAWFYYAAAHAPLAQWRVFRRERLAAARDGRTIKNALERALALDGGLQDAYFGIGLYHYYADVAPAAVKFLRFFLLLPGGDRARGLAEMLRARDGGELLRGEADYQLHWVYVWYEEQPALTLVERLDARYPSNPLFLQRAAEMQHENIGDHAASAASWRRLLDRARAGSVFAPAMTDARARIGLASELIETGEPQRAIDLVAPVVSARAQEPYGIEARALFTLGDAHARSGAVDRAIDAYDRAIARAPDGDPDAIRARARRAIAALRSAK